MRSRAQLLTRQAERVASMGILQGGAEAEYGPLQWVLPKRAGAQPHAFSAAHGKRYRGQGAATRVCCGYTPGKVKQRDPARARGQGQPALQRGRLKLRRLYTS